MRRPTRFDSPRSSSRHGNTPLSTLPDVLPVPLAHHRDEGGGEGGGGELDSRLMTGLFGDLNVPKDILIYVCRYYIYIYILCKGRKSASAREREGGKLSRTAPRAFSTPSISMIKN